MAQGSSKQLLSVVAPVYNEQEVLPETHKRLTAVLSKMDVDYEIIFVNDGSRDKSAEILEEMENKDKHVRVVSLSRNFGHAAAVSAGVDYSKGDAVVLIDADLQDPPEVIPQMLEKWREGWDVVYGKRTKRKGESFFKKATAAIFYRFLKSMTTVNIPVDVGDFRLMDRAVCDVLKGLTEKFRFVRGLVAWAGFKQIAVEYERQERFAGVTKYPLSKMIKFALDAIMGFSYKPLRLASWLGFLLSLVSFGFLVFVLIDRLFNPRPVAPGWASIVAISLFFNGVVLVILGIIGEYIGRIYDEAKGRPYYVVRPPRTITKKKG